MKVCKYFLPCGRCDKYDKACSANNEDLVNYNVLSGEISLEEGLEIKNILNCKYDECEHEWRYKGQSTNGHHYLCIKCGIMKQVPLSNLG